MAGPQACPPGRRGRRTSLPGRRLRGGSSWPLLRPRLRVRSMTRPQVSLLEGLPGLGCRLALSNLMTILPVPLPGGGLAVTDVCLATVREAYQASRFVAATLNLLYQR